MKRKYIAIPIIVLGALFTLYLYVYQGYRDISKESPDHVLSAERLAEAFEKEEVLASETYLNETLLISGILTEKDLEGITLDGKIYCGMETAPAKK